MAIKTRTCPDCRGEGYTLDGDCESCNCTGSIPDGYAFSPTAWLYVPSRELWINPDRIEDVSRTTSGAFYVTIADTDTPPLWLHIDDDVAAVTAWLEARS